jgi:GT2 family glycosyltransferase
MFLPSEIGGGIECSQHDWLIASGSLIRCEVLREVGLMREELFIDVVDTECGDYGHAAWGS